MLRDADATKAETARTLRLGAQEKLVVKDVSKDADGTTHTRYERTFAGLPVLGGDLIQGRQAQGRHQGDEGHHQGRLHPGEAAPVGRRAGPDQGRAGRTTPKLAKADKAPRKVIWAADSTPNELHVITDANTGKELFTFRGVKNGTGSSQYSGEVELGTAKEGSGYTLTDGERGGHKTLDLKNGQGGQGEALTDDDKWGTGKPEDAQTAAVDAHYGAALTWDYYKSVHGRDGIKGDGQGATSNVHYGQNYSNAFWQDSCFCMTYGDGEGNTHPLTSIDVAAHEMTHGVTSATANLTYSGESGGLN